MVPFEVTKNLSLTADKIFCSKDSLVNEEGSMLILDTAGAKSETRFHRSASQFVEPTALVQEERNEHQ